MFKLFITLDLRLFVSFNILSPCERKFREEKLLLSKKLFEKPLTFDQKGDL